MLVFKPILYANYPEKILVLIPVVQEKLLIFFKIEDNL